MNILARPRYAPFTWSYSVIALKNVGTMTMRTRFYAWSSKIRDQNHFSQYCGNLSQTINWFDWGMSWGRLVVLVTLQELFYI